MSGGESVPIRKQVEQIKNTCGRMLLSEEELLLLMADALTRTTTFEELRFLQPEDDHA